ncbi:MAG: hypothetical protein ACRD8O_07510, partial [Bryobacteraceae bacterium]
GRPNGPPHHGAAPATRRLLSPTPLHSPSFLAARKVYVSTRYTPNIGGTRVFTRFINHRDIDRLLYRVRSWCARPPRGRLLS